jgi:hypothetical protein
MPAAAAHRFTIVWTVRTEDGSTDIYHVDADGTLRLYAEDGHLIVAAPPLG